MQLTTTATTPVVLPLTFSLSIRRSRKSNLDRVSTLLVDASMTTTTPTTTTSMETDLPRAVQRNRVLSDLMILLRHRLGALGAYSDAAARCYNEYCRGQEECDIDEAAGNNVGWCRDLWDDANF